MQVSLSPAAAAAVVVAVALLLLLLLLQFGCWRGLFFVSGALCI